MTRLDVVRIRKLLELQFEHPEYGDYRTLQEKLSGAQIVDPMKISPQTVTMNSRVLYVDLESEQEHEVTVVLPEHANDKDNRISILSPVGGTLLGLTEGQIAERNLGSVQPLRIQLTRVLFQPEASGHFLL